jgi:hypothetical protein
MKEDIVDATGPLHGRIPIPPLMGAQLDLILIHKIQTPLRNQVLDMLTKLIGTNKPSSWYTTYLCVFVLLHNCAMLTEHDAGYAKKHGLEVSYAISLDAHAYTPQ